MKDIIIPSIHILLLLPRGYREALYSTGLSIILKVHRCLPAPVRLEVSAADRLQAAPSRARGQTEHVCASRASLFQCKLIRPRFKLVENQSLSIRTETIK